MQPNERLRLLMEQWILRQAMEVLEIDNLDDYQTRAGSTNMVQLKADAQVSQVTFAEQIGVSPTHLCRWLHEPDRTPNRVYRVNIKRILGGDPYEHQ